MIRESHRVPVTGSRTWSDIRAIVAVLDQVHGEHPDMVLVHGANPRGADWIAAEWARRRGVAVEPHPAQWDRDGRRRAGPIRNQEMVDAGADVCLAFIRDGSPGASHCAARAAVAGIPVRRWTA